MSVLSAQVIAESGLAAAYAAADVAGDNFVNDGKVFLHVKNGDATSKTVTITAQNTSKTIDGFGSMSKTDIAIAIPAGEERMIGAFPKSAFNDTNGKCQVTYSAVTSVTVGVIRLEPAV